MKKITLLVACCYSLLATTGCALSERGKPNAGSGLPGNGAETLTELPVASQRPTLPLQEPVPQQAIPGDIVIQETGMLADQPGFVGDKLGATVESIVIDGEQGVKTIFIVVPVDPKEVDSIEVVDHKDQPHGSVRETKLIRDYENNNVGVKLFVAPKSKMEFKLKLRDQQ